MIFSHIILHPLVHISDFLLFITSSSSFDGFITNQFNDLLPVQLACWFASFDFWITDLCLPQALHKTQNICYQCLFIFTSLLLLRMEGITRGKCSKAYPASGFKRTGKAVAPSNLRQKRKITFHTITSFRKPCHIPFRKLIPSFTLTA